MPLLSRLGSYSTRSFAEFIKHIKSWVKDTSAGTKNWRAICSDSTNTIIYSLVYGGYIQKSSDGGVSWSNLTSFGSRNWGSITCSSNGSVVYATNQDIGASYIYVSTDGGITASVSSSVSAAGTYFNSLCCSSSGAIAYATYLNYTATGGLFHTTNTGGSWASITNSMTGSIYSVCCDSTGLKIAVTAQNTGTHVQIYVSTNSGTTLTGTATYSYGFNKIVCDSTGAIIYAFSDTGGNAAIKSTNSGSTWANLSAAPAYSSPKVSCSSDGTIISVVTGGQYPSLSTNSGTSFNNQTVPGNTDSWIGNWVSPDGSHIFISSFTSSAGPFWIYA